MASLRKKGVAPLNSKRQWLPIVARVALISLIVSFCAFLLTVLVFWDADFYSARDNWEQFKIAVFGEWQQENWCPSERNNLMCEQVNDFQETFESMDDFHFFKTVAIEGTGLTVVTGVNFSSAEDVLSRRSLKHWCYLEYGATSASNTTLELGSRDGNALPNHSGLNSLSTTDETKIGLNADQLKAIAKSHCRFDLFNQQKTGGI